MVQEIGSNGEIGEECKHFIMRSCLLHVTGRESCLVAFVVGVVDHLVVERQHLRMYLVASRIWREQELSELYQSIESV